MRDRHQCTGELGDSTQAGADGDQHRWKRNRQHPHRLLRLLQLDLGQGDDPAVRRQPGPVPDGDPKGLRSGHLQRRDARLDVQLRDVHGRHGVRDGSGESGLGDAWTVNTANPMPTPTDSNPSASQGDLASSNLFLNSGGCYGSVNISSGYSYSNFGPGPRSPPPHHGSTGGIASTAPWEQRGRGQHRLVRHLPADPIRRQRRPGLVQHHRLVRQRQQRILQLHQRRSLLHGPGGAPAVDGQPLDIGDSPGGTVSVTGGTNWWGSADGAPNSGPYGDVQNGAGTLYQVERAERLHRDQPGHGRACRRLHGDHLRRHLRLHRSRELDRRTQPLHLHPGAPTGSFQVPAGLSPGTYNVYIDETNVTPLPGNGPNDAYQTARGTSLGTAESVTQLVIGTPPSVTSANNTTFTAGAAGTFTVTTCGAPNPALSESGALPSGVTFSTTATGRPPCRARRRRARAAATRSPSPPTTGSARTAPSPSRLTVDQAPAITSANHAPSRKGRPVASPSPRAAIRRLPVRDGHTADGRGLRRQRERHRHPGRDAGRRHSRAATRSPSRPATGSARTPTRPSP